MLIGKIFPLSENTLKKPSVIRIRLQEKQFLKIRFQGAVRIGYSKWYLVSQTVDSRLSLEKVPRETLYPHSERVKAKASAIHHASFLDSPKAELFSRCSRVSDRDPLSALLVSFPFASVGFRISIIPQLAVRRCYAKPFLHTKSRIAEYI